MNKSKFLRSALITNTVLLAIALPLAWWLASQVMAIATGSGGLLGMANIFVWSWLMNRMLGGNAAARSKAMYGLLFIAKFGLLLLVIFIAVNKVGLNPYGFLIGLSTMVVSLLFVGFLQATAVSDEAAIMDLEEGKKE